MWCELRWLARKVRNNSLAMIGTVAIVAVLGWWIGFFDPETCSPGAQLEGWTSCQSIAEQRNLALIALLAILLVAVLAALANKLRRARQRSSEFLG